MCGIFGIITSTQAPAALAFSQRLLDRLFVLSQSRGTEASGAAIVTNREVQIYKRACSAQTFIKDTLFRSNFIQAFKYQSSLQQKLAVIGHSRLVTNGTQSLNENNQPVVYESTTCIHNGIVVNSEKLWLKHASSTNHSEVDSQAIAYLLNKYLKEHKGIAEATQLCFSELEGAASIAALFTGIDGVLLATNTGSLYYLHEPINNISIFASESYILSRLIDVQGLQTELKQTIHHVSADNAAFLPYNGEATFFKLKANKNVELDIKKPINERVIVDLSEQMSAPVKTSFFSQNINSKELRDWALNLFDRCDDYAGSRQRCSRCILPDTMPFIRFDNNGVCSYCENYSPPMPTGKESLQLLADRIRRKNGTSDCLVGLSGGRDSCYGLHYLKKELGLNPVAFTYDWGMVTDLARRNCSRLTSKLGIEHILVSAKIESKRKYIRNNIKAWLRKPTLGMVPLFMAGDKAYFFHANRLRKQLGVERIFFCENMLERTDFKTGFAGVLPDNADKNHVYTLPFEKKTRLALYYARSALRNPAYLNSSIIDSLFGFAWYYFGNREYENLYCYIPWNEDEILTTLFREYDWERAADTDSTWRIGDGTAAFYNLIYYHVAGFTENDTFYSNLIRCGLISRKDSLKMITKLNAPRFESIAWYCQTIGIDFKKTMSIIHAIPKLL